MGVLIRILRTGAHDSGVRGARLTVGQGCASGSSYFRIVQLAE